MESLNATKKSHFIWILSSLMLNCFLGRFGISLAAEDAWMYKANMPTARVFVSGCVIDGKIYVIGGAPSPSSLTSAVEMYDPTADTWTRMANMPSARCGHATCTFNGKIYVFGGTSPSMWSTAKKNVYVYDPQTDTWTQKADMPYANAFCSIAVVDDIIYLIGGTLIESSPPVSTVMAYNPITEVWAQKTDMPTARCSSSACVVDGKIYVIGGCKEDWRVFAYKQTEVYDPSTDTWTRKSDMPTQRWGLGTCVVDGKIYAIGGSPGTAALTTNHVYVPITDTWTTKSPMRQKRYAHVVASIGDKIYAIGGSAPGILSTVEEYDTGLGIPSPDLNSDGIVDSADMCMMIDYWGTDEQAYDIAPPPFGDGIVDVQDLVLLSEHLFDDYRALAQWKLDEKAGDIASDGMGGHDGILYGEPYWQPTEGQICGALELDGIDDYFETDFVLNPVDGAFSVFTWIKGGLPGQVVISQAGGFGETWLGMDTVSGCLMTDVVPLSAGRYTPQPLISESIITDSQWHHVGFVWDGSYRALYLDGIEVAKDKAVQNPLKSADGGLYIGASKDLDLTSFFIGLIDDVRIYNQALSSEEIAALAQ